MVHKVRMIVFISVCRISDSEMTTGIITKIRWMISTLVKIGNQKRYQIMVMFYFRIS